MGRNSGVLIALVVSEWGLDFSCFPLLLGSCLPPYLAVTASSSPLHLCCSLSCDTAVSVQNYEGQIQTFPDMRKGYDRARVDSSGEQGLFLSLGKTTCCSILAFSQLLFWSHNQKYLLFFILTSTNGDYITATVMEMMVWRQNENHIFD